MDLEMQSSMPTVWLWEQYS